MKKKTEELLGAGIAGFLGGVVLTALAAASTEVKVVKYEPRPIPLPPPRPRYIPVSPVLMVVDPAEESIALRLRILQDERRDVRRQLDRCDLSTFAGAFEAVDLRRRLDRIQRAINDLL